MTQSVEVEISANAQKLIKALNKSESALNRFRENTTKAASTLKNIAIAATSFYVVAKAIDTAKEAAASFVETAAKFEQFETVLQTIEGSAEKAKESMRWITDFTKNTPYQLEQVTESFVKLKAYGLEPTKGLLKTLGDTSAAMGKPILQAVEAIADAVTGENERLKEFGIKASLQGNKVAYAWTDASGKAKHIVIENNKEIIQSTLEAIFNSKYAGAMQMQSKTWNGLISNIKDNWTLFKKDIIDAGLFNYLKSIVIVVGDYLKRAFGSAKEGAKDFALGAISLIKSTIKGVGYLIDIWNVFKLGLNTLQVVFGKLMQFAIKGLQGFSNAAAKAYNFIMQGWVKFTNFLGRGWTAVINFFLKGWNKFVTGISSAWNAVADVLHLPTIKPATVDLKEFKAETVNTIAVAKDFSKELSFWKQYTAENKQEMLDYYGKVATGAGSNFADRFIKAVDATYNKLKKTDALKVDKSKYEEQLKKLGAKGGAFKGFEKAAKKAGKAAKKAHKDAEKAAKAHRKELEKLKKQAEKLKLQYADIFKNSLSSLLKGDFKGAFSNLFDGLSSKLMEPLLTNISNYLSTTLNNFTSGMGAFGKGLLGFGLSLIPNLFGSLFGGHKLTEAEIKTAKGRTDFSDDSLKRLANVLEKVKDPLLPYTKKMTEYLASLNKNFLVLGRALSTSATFDYTGANYKDHGGSFLGWGDSYQKIGSGITLNNIDFGSGSVSGYGYLTEKVHESSWFGLVQDEYVKETKKVLDSGIKSIIQKSILDGKKIILDSSKILGYNVEEALNKVKVSLGKINLDGLSSEEISKRLNNALSEVFSKAIGKLGDINKLVNKYAEAGEEQLATLSRIAIYYEQASDLLKNINFDLTDTVKYKTQKWFLGLFTEIKKQVYTAQEKVLDIVKFSGGLDKFTENYNSFFNNYYTDTEKLRVYKNTLRQQFNSLGITLPKTKQEFKKLVESFKVTDEATAKTYAELLKLSSAYNSFADLQEKIRKEQLNKEKERLQKVLDWNKQILSKLEDFWAGSLSYLNSTEKANKLQELANYKIQSGDVVGYLETQRKALEFEKKIARTREEYALKADRYVYELQKSKPSKTLDDVVKSIEELKVENARIREETVKTAKTQLETDKKLTKALIDQNKKIERAIEANNYKVQK